MVRRRACAVSNHEIRIHFILRDAAERPLLRMRRDQCDLAKQNATTCSSAVFIGEAGNSASASTAIAP